MHFPKFLFILLAFISCQKQIESKADINIDEIELSDEVKMLKDSIAKGDAVEFKKLGIAGIESQQFQRYVRLRKIASDLELYKLGYDPSPAVATYAGYGLAFRNNELFQDIFYHYLKNDKQVFTINGCLFGKNSVADELYYCYHTTLYLYNILQKDGLFDKDDNTYGITDKIDEEDQLLLNTLDSLIIYTDSINWMLYERVFVEQIYPKSYLERIEHLAFTKGEIHSIEYLHKRYNSKYKEQIILKLKELLNHEVPSTYHYEKIFDIMLSYKDPELDDILLLELEDVKKLYGQGYYEEYRKKFGLLYDEESRVKQEMIR